MRLTAKDIQNRLDRKYHGYIILNGKYKGMEKQTSFRCTLHHINWKVRPHNLIYGHSLGCPINRKKKLSLERHQRHGRKGMGLNWFKHKLANSHNNTICLLDESLYKNMSTKTWFHCKVCGNNWRAVPTSITSGNQGGCPKCNARRQRHSNNWFLDKLHAIHGNNIKPLEVYKGLHKIMSFHCNVCGNPFKNTPDQILFTVQHKDYISHPQGCPWCAMRKHSRGEYCIFLYLKHHGLKPSTDRHYSKANNDFIHGCIGIPWLNGLHADFYIPIIKTVIEFNGIEHFRPTTFGGRSKESSIKHFKIRQRLDKYKMKLCKNNNARIIEVNKLDDSHSKTKLNNLVQTVLDNQLLPLLNNKY